jgi:hypothetical protein
MVVHYWGRLQSPCSRSPNWCSARANAHVHYCTRIETHGLSSGKDRVKGSPDHCCQSNHRTGRSVAPMRLPLIHTLLRNCIALTGSPVSTAAALLAAGRCGSEAGAACGPLLPPPPRADATNCGACPRPANAGGNAHAPPPDLAGCTTTASGWAGRPTPAPEPATAALPRLPGRAPAALPGPRSAPTSAASAPTSCEGECEAEPLPAAEESDPVSCGSGAAGYPAGAQERWSLLGEAVAEAAGMAAALLAADCPLMMTSLEPGKHRTLGMGAHLTAARAPAVVA